MAKSRASSDYISPYDRLSWSDREVEHLLATGIHRRELVSYFGAVEYRELARLARAARIAVARADAPRVFIVPGIMGSQLGQRRRAPLPDDVLWLDPIDITAGRLNKLKPARTDGVVSLGVVFTLGALGAGLHVAKKAQRTRAFGRGRPRGVPRGGHFPIVWRALRVALVRATASAFSSTVRTPVLGGGNPKSIACVLSTPNWARTHAFSAASASRRAASVSPTVPIASRSCARRRATVARASRHCW